jgi:hypothetical protein
MKVRCRFSNKVLIDVFSYYYYISKAARRSLINAIYMHMISVMIKPTNLIHARTNNTYTGGTRVRIRTPGYNSNIS